ncbi:MAG TPA: tryptophan synthase subunit beta [Candidatus Aminicenantes bacterium]|nr:tryptophan synthase subunit beta [Candidatus Aminicenantes bacterium]
MKPKKIKRFYGVYGGRYVPEMLIPALEELESAFLYWQKQKSFRSELDSLLRNYAGRPTPLYYAENLTRETGGGEIHLKLEGLAHTGAHKINNVLGQALLAVKMGKKHLIAETGAGQHGLATASAAARFGMRCRVFMGKVDIARQHPNVFFMQRLGAEVIAVNDGGGTLKNAVNAAIRDWTENLSDGYYLVGSALGPHPYPALVKNFQSIIGREVKSRLQSSRGRRPDLLVACVGGGSNAIGLFAPFLKHNRVRFLAAEAGGDGNGAGRHAARFSREGRVGIAQGYKSRFLQDADGQILPTHSISAGLDYAGIGPELAAWVERGRIEVTRVSDSEALAAFEKLCRLEGIIPALESAHAVHAGISAAASLPKRAIVVINISGRGEKDLFITAGALDREKWRAFLLREAMDG